MAFQRTSTEGIATSEFDSLYAFANLTIALVVSMPSYLQHTRLERASVMENMQTLLSLLKGTYALVTSDPAKINDSVFQVTMDYLMLPPPELTDESTRNALARLKLISHDESAASLGSCTEKSYLDAIGWLRNCFAYYDAGKYNYLMAWPLTIDIPMLRALETYDNVALLLLLHWAVLLHRLSGHKWWVKDAGKLLVSELTPLMSRKDDIWVDCIYWVHQQVGLSYYANTYPRALSRALDLRSAHLG
jgi:hypothetical protein